MNISIFGLGYVGAVSAACLSNAGHRVIGVDTSDHKVDCINRGISPIVEPGMEEVLKSVVAAGKLSATTDARSAIMNSDLTLVCVGTPSNANGSLNLDYVMRVAEQIGTLLKEKNTFHGVVVRSTVLPGTIEKVEGMIASSSGKSPGEDFDVASNPEFLREGTSLADFNNPPFTVVGAASERMVSMLRETYESVSAPFHVVKVREAELLKYACNAFHAVKVTFANEIGAIAREIGVDSHVVMGIFCRDTKLNISPYYLKPGFAFGGSCLPKDVRAITYQSKAVDVSTPLLDSLMPSNEQQIHKVVNWVLQKKKKNVGVLGLSFKSNTDDLRESPIVRVVEALLGKGHSVAIYDANVNLSKLIGANRSYIEQEIPHISTLMRSSIDEVLAHGDVVIVANRHEEFKNVTSRIRSGQVVLDLVRITDHWEGLDGRYEGIGW